MEKNEQKRQYFNDICRIYYCRSTLKLNPPEENDEEYSMKRKSGNVIYKITNVAKR